MNRNFSLLNLRLADGVKPGLTILVLGGEGAGGGGTGRTQKKQTRAGWNVCTHHYKGQSMINRRYSSFYHISFNAT